MSNHNPIAALMHALSSLPVHPNIQGLKYVIVDTVNGPRRLDFNELVTPPNLNFSPELIGKKVLELEGRIDQLQATQVELEPLYEDVKPFEPEESVAIGDCALANGSKDRHNVAVGAFAGYALEGSGNVVIGPYAATGVNYELDNSVVIGNAALPDAELDLTNVIVVGAHARATGSNQFVLGHSGTDAYNLSGLHRRADVRDFTNIEDLDLGLDFILQVPVIQYQVDPREAYIDWSTKPEEPQPPGPEPEPVTLADSQEAIIAYNCRKAQWDRDQKQYTLDMANYVSELNEWSRVNNLANIERTGEFAGKRTHYGYNGRALLDLCERFGVNPALVQDHAVAEGDAQITVNDAHLVPVLIRAVQQLHKTMHSPEYIDTLISAIETKKNASS